MNYLISAYSVCPNCGSEEGVGWNWVLQYEKNWKPGDRIILLTRNSTYYNSNLIEGFKSIKHIELAITDVPNCLNWFRDKYSAFHHLHYKLWQHWAYKWVKKSNIKFDVIHHATMGDYRILSEMYKIKNAKTIFGPVGGAQTTPASLKHYENGDFRSKIREIINKLLDFNPSYKRKIKKFTLAIASNKETYNQLKKITNENLIQEVELGINDNQAMLKLNDKGNEALNVMFAGRLIPKKGIDFLVDMAKEIPKSSSFKINIYGDGFLMEHLKCRIKDEALENLIIIKGNVPYKNMSEAYSKADIFIMTSLRETGGTVLLEAMANAVPIVSFDTSFCSQLNEQNVGIFIDVNQSFEKVKKDFANAIVTLAENPKLRNQLGQNGYKYVNSRLKWEDKYKIIFNQLKKRG